MHAWARELRYGAAMRLAEELDAREGSARPRSPESEPEPESEVEPKSEPKPESEPERTRVAAGHTASDQVETILYRLAASPGRRALLGMAPCEGRLVRPLLEVTRE